MTYPLPPLNGLRAFEAAARHRSFKKAAEELHVTPAAISQQVRALEEFVGRPLFRRLTRAIVLTDAGAAAAPHLKEGFERLRQGAEVMRLGRVSNVLTVSVAPSFAAKWLVPRLDRFRSRHPDYDVRIDAADALANFEEDGVDLALRYGSGTYANLVSDCLMSEFSFPVCSPRLLADGPPLREPSDLAAHTLLHVQWKMEAETAPNWRMWLRAAGATNVDVERGPRFSVDSMAVQAAIEGHGVALASNALASDDIEAGRLVRPFPPSVCEATKFCYYLVFPPENAEDPKVKAFRGWIKEEVALSKEPAEAATLK
ncbi:MAG: transcriptional regulator GcvA [Paracoccaceae bacterium]